MGHRHISTSGFASTAIETAVFALFLPVQAGNRYKMVQMDFLAANHVRIVGLCVNAHRAVIFAIAQLSYKKRYHFITNLDRFLVPVRSSDCGIAAAVRPIAMGWAMLSGGRCPVQC